MDLKIKKNIGKLPCEEKLLRTEKVWSCEDVGIHYSCLKYCEELSEGKK
jgi:hypothetical protein